MRRAIFITGGGSGIGRAVAQHFAGRGWFVGLGDIDEAGIAETARLIGAANASLHRMDVRSRDHWRAALAAFVAASGGRLDVLFNNAGVGRGGPFALMSEADRDLVIDVNVKGVMYGAEAALPHLAATPGSVLLNTGSAAGLYGSANMACYAASKFAVKGFTEALAQEWAAHGVAVRSIMPSFIDTPLLDPIGAGSNRSGREMVEAMGLEFTPLDEVAERVWDAVHGTRVHTLIGKTARRLAFAVRFAPFLLKRMRRPVEP
jgi:NAD(P)-dependent dehydrogenase (short-subunit alcohol dehydrogenase family)